MASPIRPEGQDRLEVDLGELEPVFIIMPTCNINYFLTEIREMLHESPPKYILIYLISFVSGKTHVLNMYDSTSHS